MLSSRSLNPSESITYATSNSVVLYLPFALGMNLWLTTGSDVMKRIAAPMIGGILTSFLLELVVYPPVYQIWKWNFEVKKSLTPIRE